MHWCFTKTMCMQWEDLTRKPRRYSNLVRDSIWNPKNGKKWPVYTLKDLNQVHSYWMTRYTFLVVFHRTNKSGIVNVSFTTSRRTLGKFMIIRDMMFHILLELLSSTTVGGSTIWQMSFFSEVVIIRREHITCKTWHYLAMDLI